LTHHENEKRFSKNFSTENPRIFSLMYNIGLTRIEKSVNQKVEKKHASQNYAITSLHNWP
jgi:hypothetical protein